MAFSWTFYKLSNFELCPKRHYEIDVAKNVKDTSEQMTAGNEVHNALAKAIKTRQLMSGPLAPYNKHVQSVLKWPGEIFVEQKYALTRQLQACEYFGPHVWYRGIGDVVAIAPPVAMILDWKTGKPKMDSKQLMLLAQCVFSFHPDVDEVTSMFVWLAHGTHSKELYQRSAMPSEWIGMLPRVQRMEQAAASMSYPPTPNKLCRKHCPVISCPHHGNGL